MYYNVVATFFLLSYGRWNLYMWEHRETMTLP